MNKTIKNIPPKYLKWGNEIYEYIANKQGILLYGCQEYDHFDDYFSSRILVIEHRKDKPVNDAFYVLFCTLSNSFSREIVNLNLKNQDRLAKPYEYKH